MLLILFLITKNYYYKTYTGTEKCLKSFTGDSEKAFKKFRRLELQTTSKALSTFFIRTFFFEVSKYSSLLCRGNVPVVISDFHFVQNSFTLLFDDPCMRSPSIPDFKHTLPFRQNPYLSHLCSPDQNQAVPCCKNFSLALKYTTNYFGHSY